jgi:hypothetical protein
MLRRLCSRIAVVALIGLVTACAPGGASDPAVKSSTSASSTSPAGVPTQRSTPTATAPAEADAATLPRRPKELDGEPSPEGAVAVARYFIQLYPYAYATGDLTAWNSLSSPHCKFCKSTHDNVLRATKQGTHDSGGLIEINDEHVRENSPGSSYEVVFDFIQHESRTLDPKGNVVETYPEEDPSRMSIVLHWGKRGWVVRGVSVHEIPS